MDADLGSPLPSPKRLKLLASNVEYSGGNTLLHQFVLDNFNPKKRWSENCINAVFLSVSDDVVNAVNGDGYTALHMAVLEGSVLMVRKLLSCFKSVDVNKKCSYGERNAALHMAAQLTHADSRSAIIGELLSKGADINLSNRDDMTALCLAVRSGDLDAMKLLISQGADVNSSTPFRDGRFYIPTLDLRSKFPPLYLAAQSGHLEAVKYLVSQGADVGAIESLGKRNSLHVTAQHLAIIEFLVGKGADIHAEDACGHTPICYAAQRANLDVIQFLLDRGAHADWNCLFLHASWSDSIKIMQFAIDNGADINTRHILGHTPLLHAIMLSKIPTVEYLVRRGADIHAKNKKGKTPLHKAVSWNELQCAEILISQGADVNERDKEGRTPLHDAVIQKWGLSTDIVKMLIERGADVNLKDASEGATPLHLLHHYNGPSDIRTEIQLLLEGNADPKLSVSETERE